MHLTPISFPHSSQTVRKTATRTATVGPISRLYYSAFN